jgi:hypothetical protein
MGIGDGDSDNGAASVSFSDLGLYGYRPTPNIWYWVGITSPGDRKRKEVRSGTPSLLPSLSCRRPRRSHASPPAGGREGVVKGIGSSAARLPKRGRICALGGKDFSDVKAERRIHREPGFWANRAYADAARSCLGSHVFGRSPSVRRGTPNPVRFPAGCRTV